MILLTSLFPYLILSLKRDQLRLSALPIHGLMLALDFVSPPLLAFPRPQMVVFLRRGRGMRGRPWRLEWGI